MKTLIFPLTRIGRLSPTRALIAAAGMALAFRDASAAQPSKKIETQTVAGVTLVAIPGGSFQMGLDRANADMDEKPVHKVTLSPFFIGRTQVTQEQYQAVMGANPSHFSGFDNLPVESVTWYQAVKFCNRLSAKAGLQRCYDETTWKCDFSRDGIRLPTEAEYEYAARAGTTTLNWSGDTYLDLCRVAWIQGNSGSKTHPVATKPANPFGLYDIQGNGWEWCNDWYRWDYYAVSPEFNPKGAPYGMAKVARGGRFYSWSWHARISKRSAIPLDYVSDGYGFRIARSRIEK